MRSPGRKLAPSGADPLSRRDPLFRDVQNRVRITTMSETSAFSHWFSERLAEQAESLCREWLDRLLALLPEEAHEIFPTETLLDHVPLVIRGLARDVSEPITEGVAISSAITEKARELGDLRFSQRASVHQILREYAILAELLSKFLVDSLEEAPGEAPTTREALHISERLNDGIRILMQASVDSFSERYTETIERQRAQLESFNRMITHEIRNPLNSLELGVDLLTEENMSPSGVEKVAGLLHRSVDRITHLLRNLEALVTVDEDPDGPTRQELELSGIANDVVDQLSDMIDARDVEVRIDGSLPRIVSDPHRVEMILLNLIANGIKYSDRGKEKRWVTVEHLATDTAETELTIQVRDNGIGIPTDQQEAVFGRFFRAHKDRDSELGVRGSGLGLSIVADCVSALDGTVELESVEGEGTTVTVRFSAHALPKD